MNKIAKTGNEAVAEAMRQINPDVVAAYPITPATEIVQIFAQYVADGLVTTEFIPTESEHSAMSACIGSSAAGARTMTGTASQGLALMWEMLYIASGLRLPIVMSVANRALSSPINIHGDQSDVMGARDSGWIQIYAENTQEMYDSIIQAVKIAETAKLPVLVTMDGFIISHCMETIETIDTDAVKQFVGTYQPAWKLLDVDNPHTVGALDLQDYYFEHRKQLAAAMYQSKLHINQIQTEFKNKFNRSYGLYETYYLDDAESVIVVLGSAAGTIKQTVKTLRAQGRKVGLLRLRVFRPFPWEEINQALANIKSLAVLDRADSIAGFGGPVFDQIRSALYENNPRPRIINYIYGLGGRDLDTVQISKVYDELDELNQTHKTTQSVRYLGVRE